MLYETDIISDKNWKGNLGDSENIHYFEQMPTSKINFPTLPTFPVVLPCGSVSYPQKNAKFSCKSCDFYTSKSCNYIEHLKTKKHKITIITNPVNGGNLTVQASPEASQPPESRKIYPCKNCNRPYFSKKGLWQHSKKCTVSPSSKNIESVAHSPTTTDKTPVELMSSMMLEMFKTNQEQMMQMIGAVLLAVKSNTAVDAVQEPSIHTTNNANNNLTVNGNMTNMSNMHNKTFNINMFLNEQCKDAMNMTEFVNTIELDTDDMKDVGKHGFVKGISKIFIENLEKTEVTKRPIHCSDIKREILYIKDDDKWERDNIKSQKLVNAVRVVEKKNVDQINKWAKENPECENSDSRANTMYMTLSRHGFDGDDDNVTKVVKNIAHNVIIDKDEYAS